jgi:hypothetical protein
MTSNVADGQFSAALDTADHLLFPQIFFSSCIKYILCVTSDYPSTASYSIYCSGVQLNGGFDKFWVCAN